MDWNAILQSILNAGIKIVISLIIMWIAFRIINAIAKRINKKIEASDKIDKTIGKTLVRAGRVLAKCLVAIALVGYLGIDTSGIAALVASLGVAFGLAVNGALANIAGGVLLILTRPFKVDDFVDIGGQIGTVEAINLVYTKLVTIDNKVVSIPNGSASASTIINFSEKKLRRVDYNFAIAYTADFEKAKAILLDLCRKHEKVLEEPAPVVRVITQTGGTVELVVRAWVNGADYWDVYFDLLENAKKALQEAGIAMPHQQLDVHIKQD